MVVYIVLLLKLSYLRTPEKILSPADFAKNKHSISHSNIDCHMFLAASFTAVLLPLIVLGMLLPVL